MKIYSKKEAISQMNILAKADIPFLFIIDYTGESSYIMKMDEIESSSCLYQFEHINNVSQKDLPSISPIHWEYNPPVPAKYQQAFNIVKQNLLAGNSYLTNLTCKVPISTNLSLKEIFQRSEALYKLWIKDKFVCFSPEIFIRIDKGIIRSYPMKGTLDATLPHAESLLINDEKEAAEHATIVDLIRNDLSMVANHVNVTSYRYIDYLKTNKGPILQTSSEICGKLPENYHENIGNMLFRLLPAGSITGAPKAKTMQIISEAEKYDRGFYTGVMGYYAHKKLDSGVMIRFIDQENGELFFKAGGGITAKSKWEAEYNEVKQKIYVPIY